VHLSICIPEGLLRADRWMPLLCGSFLDAVPIMREFPRQRGAPAAKALACDPSHMSRGIAQPAAGFLTSHRIKSVKTGAGSGRHACAVVRMPTGLSAALAVARGPEGKGLPLRPGFARRPALLARSGPAPLETAQEYDFAPAEFAQYCGIRKIERSRRRSLLA